MSKSLFETIFKYSKKIHKRSKYYVLSKTMEEVGELATEVAIDAGECYKKPGKDGIVGEALDAIVCLIDMIYLEAPDITEDELVEMIKPKCKKWLKKTKEFYDEKD